MDYSYEFKVRGKEYRVTVPADAAYYCLSRKAGWGGFEKIPCMTDAEERAYPVQAAWMATMFLEGIRQAQQAPLAIR